MSLSLKDVLDDLFTTDIETKLNSQPNVGIYIWDKEKDKSLDDKSKLEPLPKFRVNEMLETSKTKITNLETQINTFETQSKEHEKQLKDLKKAADGNPELQKQIEDLQKSNKDKDVQIEKIKEDSAKNEQKLVKTLKLKEHLLNSEVYDAQARELLVKNFDIEKLEIGEDGKIKGFDELLKPIKENKTFSGFFGKEIVQGNEHQNGGDPEFTGEYFTEEQLNSMTQKDMVENYDKVQKSIKVINKK
ncbi:MAG: phage scaffolding protein [Bacteroidales bacterium]